MKALFFITSFIGMLIGCNFTPEYKRPSINLLLEKEKPNDPIYLSWQNFFSSPAVQAVIEKTLYDNANYKAQEIQLEILAKQYDISKIRLVTPDVTASGGYNRTNAPTSPLSPNYAYTAGVFASYEIDIFGAISALKSSALSSFLEGEENIKSLRISLISETVISYITALSSKKMIEIYKQIVSLQEQQERITKKQVEEGLSSQINLINASYDLQYSKGRLSAFERAFQESALSLSQLTASDSSIFFQKEADIEQIKFAESSLSNLPSESLLKRPDIKKAEYALQGINAQIGAARAAFFPSISLTGNFGYASAELNELFSGKGIWGFNPTINIPIFTGGRTAANRDISYLRKNLYINQYENSIITAFYEIQSKFLIKNLIDQKKHAFEALLETRKESLKIAKAGYRGGLQNLKTSLAAEVAYLSAFEGYIGALTEYLILLTDIYRVLGGGSAVL